MNDLAMAPLPARTKKETDVAGEKTVFRCGVLSCPEVLGVVRADFQQERFIFRGPYMQNKDGVFVHTRRSARRFEGEREHDKRTKTDWAELIQERKNLVALDPSEANVEALNRFVASIEDYQGLHDKHQLEGLQIPSPDLFPLTVKCAQCGRLSKIQGAG